MAEIIFDLDGTLIDSAPDIRAAVNDMLRAEGVAPLDLSTVISFVGNGLPKLVERVIRHCRMDMGQHARLTADVLEHYGRSSANLTRPYPFVEDVLARLQAGGHRMGICTNKPHGPAVHILLELGMDRYFDVVIGGDSTERKKPDPLPLRRTMAEMQARQVLYVGDNEIDAATARGANVAFALFSEGYRKRELSDIPHDFLFSDYRRLPDFVETLF